jgi:hypothetical protein
MTRVRRALYNRKQAAEAVAYAASMEVNAEPDISKESARPAPSGAGHLHLVYSRLVSPLQSQLEPVGKERTSPANVGADFVREREARSGARRAIQNRAADNLLAGAVQARVQDKPDGYGAGLKPAQGHCRARVTRLK